MRIKKYIILINLSYLLNFINLDYIKSEKIKLNIKF